jgi:hypothetical protein
VRKFLIVLLAVLLLVPGVVHAQKDLKCDSSQVNAIINLVIKQLAAAKNKDTASALTDTVRIQGIFARLEVACFDIGFSGGMGSHLHGPIYVPGGVYRITVLSRYFYMSSLVLEGGCWNRRRDEYNVIHVAGQEADVKSEAAFQSDGCLVLFEVEADWPYTVTCERVY